MLHTRVANDCHVSTDRTFLSFQKVLVDSTYSAYNPSKILSLHNENSQVSNTELSVKIGLLFFVLRGKNESFINVILHKKLYTSSAPIILLGEEAQVSVKSSSQNFAENAKLQQFIYV